MHTTFDWNRIHIVGILILLGILMGCNQAMEANTAVAAESDASQTRAPQVPPMDAEAPETFETASFGLG